MTKKCAVPQPVSKIPAHHKRYWSQLSREESADIG
jgi:hypothetical protein